MVIDKYTRGLITGGTLFEELGVDTVPPGFDDHVQVVGGGLSPPLRFWWGCPEHLFKLPANQRWGVQTTSLPLPFKGGLVPS